VDTIEGILSDFSLVKKDSGEKGLFLATWLGIIMT